MQNEKQQNNLNSKQIFVLKHKPVIDKQEYTCFVFVCFFLPGLLLLFLYVL